MRTTVKTKLAAVAVVSALGCFSLAGCAGESAAVYEYDPTLDPRDTSGGVAATVNGVEIGENAITAYIEDFRATNGLEDDAVWGEWLGSSDYTIDSLRQAVVDIYVNKELIRQLAADKGVEVTDEEVDKKLAQEKKQYGSETKWKVALKQLGMTEQQYREQVELSLLQNKLFYLASGASELDDMANQIISQMEQSGGAELASLLRKGMAALSKDSDAVKASDEQVLQLVAAYEQDYADAASLDEVPEDVVEAYRPYADYAARQQTLSDMMEAFRGDAVIVVNDAPAQLSYAVEIVVPEPASAEDGQAAAGDAAAPAQEAAEQPNAAADQTAAAAQ